MQCCFSRNEILICMARAEGTNSNRKQQADFSLLVYWFSYVPWADASSYLSRASPWFSLRLVVTGRAPVSGPSAARRSRSGYHLQPFRLTYLDAVTLAVLRLRPWTQCSLFPFPLLPSCSRFLINSAEILSSIIRFSRRFFARFTCFSQVISFILFILNGI